MIELLKNDAAGKLVLRLTLGILMLFHGVAKLLHPGSLEFIGGRLAGMGLPEALAYGMYIGELVAPLMIILGIFCRAGCLLVVINMVITVWWKVSQHVSGIAATTALITAVVGIAPQP